MKQYKVVKTCKNPEDTEANLNVLAQAGWEVKCSYCHGGWFVMEKEIFSFSTCA